MVKAKFEHLRIWQDSHRLMLECHQIVNILPFSQKARGDQLKRSSSSSPDNIAECVGSYYYNDKIKSLSIARKESTESQNHLIALKDQKLVDSAKVDELVERYENLIKGINAYKKKVIESRNSYKLIDR